MGKGARSTRTFLVGIALGFEGRELFLELERVRLPVSVVIVLGRAWKAGVEIQEVGCWRGRVCARSVICCTYMRSTPLWACVSELPEPVTTVRLHVWVRQVAAYDGYPNDRTRIGLGHSTGDGYTLVTSRPKFGRKLLMNKGRESELLGKLLTRRAFSGSTSPVSHGTPFGAHSLTLGSTMRNALMY